MACSAGETRLRNLCARVSVGPFSDAELAERPGHSFPALVSAVVNREFADTLGVVSIIASLDARLRRLPAPVLLAIGFVPVAGPEVSEQAVWHGPRRASRTSRLARARSVRAEGVNARCVE